jgi:hypothetical protein
LDEAYQQVVSHNDVGLVARNLELAKRTCSIIGFLFDSKANFLDYGGGYGLFVRLMRDYGFDFSWYDEFSSNIFAYGFDANLKMKQQFELITSFEVFEHLVDPIKEMKKIIQYSRNILFSTRLIPQPPPKPGEWVYYGVENGQHITFYTPFSLRILAEMFGLKFYSNGINLHLFTDKKMSNILFRLLSSIRLSSFLSVFFKRASLTEKDAQYLTKHFD